MNELKNVLKSKKGEGVVIISIFLLLFIIAISVVGLDFASFYDKNMKVKAGINRAVKGAALQVDTDILDTDGNNLSAKGIFIIHQAKADNTFKYLLSENLGLENGTLEPLTKSILNSTPEIIEFEILNDYKNMPYEYHSKTLDSNFLVENPSVFVVLKFQVNSYFLKQEFTFGKLSSAELINKEN